MEIQEPETQLAQNFGDFVERRMAVDELGRLNGEAMERVAALDEGTEICFASYAPMAEAEEDLSFWRTPVARVEKPGRVL